jgi:hypothetical protein
MFGHGTSLLTSKHFKHNFSGLKTVFIYLYSSISHFDTELQFAKVPEPLYRICKSNKNGTRDGLGESEYGLGGFIGAEQVFLVPLR